MRRILVGLLFLLLIRSAALAQATGEVESIGFQSYFRPNCWTPMVVRLHPQTNEPGTFQLQVWQHDQEGDRPRFTRTITLNGSDTARDQRFWMYFLPQPINHGLPDSTNGTLKDLQHDLQVFLCTASGKQIAQLPITSTITNVDPSTEQRHRSQKLILAVSGNGSRPAAIEYENTVGVQEAPVFVSLQPRDLPEDLMGFEAVDAILWLDADPAELDQAGQHKLRTIQDYVRFGGQLVICQPSDWRRTLAFGDLLPVNIEKSASKADLEPLVRLAVGDGADRTIVRSWNNPVGPFPFVRASAKPGGVVAQWIDWNHDAVHPDNTPYLVRQGYGLGSVTWVAQDLGSINLTSRTLGWPAVWDTVFGWANRPIVRPTDMKADSKEWRALELPFASGAPVDVGYGFMLGLNFGSTGAKLIFIAIFFFILYWLAAGPIGYIVLSRRKQARLNWFIFAAAAIVATAITVLVVKLVLRGPPQIKHLSFVRIAPNQPAVVESHIALYIKRDGPQQIELVDPAQRAMIANYAPHPQQLGDVTESPSPADYYVPLRDSTDTTPAGIEVPYRSSMKKFQARWVGDLPNSHLTSHLKLEPDNRATHLSGTITNSTDHDFKDVYLAFNASRDIDWMLYIPLWPHGQTIDIARDFTVYKRVGHGGGMEQLPGAGYRISDQLSDPKFDPSSNNRQNRYQWLGYLYGPMFHGGGMGAVNSVDGDFIRLLPLVSLIDRLPPAVNSYTVETGLQGPVRVFTDDRFELFHRGVRMLNASPALAAGNLVVMAISNGPMPVKLSVNGQVVDADGPVLYQFIVPLERPATTQPGN